MYTPSLFHLKVTLLGLLFSSAFAFIAAGAPLEEAKVHKIIKDVWVVDTARGGSRAAVANDVIKGSLAVRTGVQSRTELLFQDETLTRLGAESFFTFTPGTRDITLDRGTMLLQVPKGHGGAHISTAAVTAAITGTTIMIENKPGDHVKVLVLEGSLRLSHGKGDNVTLTPGKMIIMGASDKRLPKAVAVDLQKVVKTSTLIDPAKFKGTSKVKVAELPSMPLIDHEVNAQEAQKRTGRLTETKLVINGGGSDVMVASKPALDALRTTPESAPAVLSAVAKRDRANAPLVKQSDLRGMSAGDNGSLVANSTSLKKATDNSNNSLQSNGGNSNGKGKGKGGGNGKGDNNGKGNNDNGDQGNGKGNTDNKGKGDKGNGKGKG